MAYNGPHTRARKPAVYAHELVQKLFEAVDQQGLTFVALAEKAGYHANTIERWRKGRVPDVVALAHCLEVVGMKLTAQPQEEE